MPVREFLTYGDGIPRYATLWLPLAPLLVGGLAALRVRRGVVVAIAATTLPTFLLHNPPERVPYPMRWLLLEALFVGIAWWLARRVVGRGERARRDTAERAHRPVPWTALGALALLAIAVRAPLAWVDPGISDIPRASETAARQLLAGVNPYMVANPHTVVGAYQYPAGSVLLHVPFVALLPAEALGEPWFPARVLLWVASAVGVLLLGWAGARLGGSRAGLATALILALHPTLVRESALTVANDVLLGLLAAGAAVALARRRPLWCGALVGLAVSVKPAALVLLPLVGSWPAVTAAVAVPVGLQLPFLLFPTPGAHGLAAMAEPASRADPAAVLRYSTWWPLYAAAQPPPRLLALVAGLGVLLAVAVAVWAGIRLRRAGSGGRAPAAVALALLAAFALGHRLRLNFQDWYLVPFALAACLDGAPGVNRGNAAHDVEEPARLDVECNPIATEHA